MRRNLRKELEKRFKTSPKKHPVVSFRLDEETLGLLERAKEESGFSKSKIIKLALERFLEPEKEKGRAK